MKLEALYETGPDGAAMFNAGINCTPGQFKLKFDYIIEFQDRLQDLYKDIVDKLHVVVYEEDPGYDVPQITSMIFVHGHELTYASIKLDEADEDIELHKRGAKTYILRAFQKFTPEIEVQYDPDGSDDLNLNFSLKMKHDTPLWGLQISYTAPEADDSKHSNARRKALKWW